MVKKSFDIYNFILSNKIIFFILLIIILLTIIYYNNSTYESFHINHLKYFRCDTKKLGFITNEVFNEYGITKDNTNWNIYVPCGYNYVEKELLTIQVSNNSDSDKNSEEKPQTDLSIDDENDEDLDIDDKGQVTLF